ncbi:MAG TPA: PorV/PorQ family protein [Chitinophagaceae bacterium]|nr:PorV/PorQ family protein [Chitinophagaceae bacterium]
MKRSFLLTGIALLSAAAAYTQPRIYVNEYLNIGVGGRGLAMGGAQVASSSDANSGYWNPAGLTNIGEDLQVGLMHAEYFAGNAKYDFASVAMPTKDKKRAFGVSFLRFATDDIPYTIDYIQPDGSFDESKLKSISAGDYAFLLSYAQKLKLFRNPEIQTSIGANAKIVYRNIGSMANAWGGGVDVGFQARYRRLLLGLSVKDATTTYTTWSFNLTEREKEVFGQTGNEIPVKSYEVMNPRFNIGAGYNFMKPSSKIQLLAELNADLTTDGMRNTLIRSKSLSIDPRAGFELSYKQTIFLRAGVSNIQKVLDDRDSLNKKTFTIFQPSIGVGLKLGPIVADYAYTSLQTQSNPLFSHIVSLRFDIKSLSKSKKEDKADTDGQATPPVQQ